jgi:PKHD-type hydroxylase
MNETENIDYNSYMIPWCYWDNAFKENELEEIINLSNKKPLRKGVTFDVEKTDSYRNSMINFHSYNDENKWIFDRLNGVIKSINDSYYNFDLGGYDDYQYSEYYSYEKGRYDYHMDMSIGTNHITPPNKFRKLSLSLLLNEPYIDFEGGDFYLNLGRESESERIDIKKGRIILFPSFLIHKVTPVIEGVRKSLVVWVEGPKFK